MYITAKYHHRIQLKSHSGVFPYPKQNNLTKKTIINFYVVTIGVGKDISAKKLLHSDIVTLL